MTHDEKLNWMAIWAAKNGVALELQGECGFGRECVGIIKHDVYPDFERYDEKYNDVCWAPPDAYHKHDCVAVLGRGEAAEGQLYDWLKWFDDNGYVVEAKRKECRDDGRAFDAIDFILGAHNSVKMVKKGQISLQNTPTSL